MNSLKPALYSSYKLSLGIAIFTFVGAYSCQSSNYSEQKQVEISELNDQHPDKSRMEFLLNHYSEPFVAYSDLIEREDSDLIIMHTAFETTTSHTIVNLVFCKDQSDATKVYDENKTTLSSTSTSGINGATLFIVKGTNNKSVNDLVSYFAGEE